MSKSNKKVLLPKDREALIRTLKSRFEKNKNRHQGIEWAKVQAKVEANPEKMWSLNEMEITGGEPDVVAPGNIQKVAGNDKKKMNTFFMIVPLRVLQAAGVFATIPKRWHQEKNINQKIVRWVWQQTWVLKF